MPNIDRINSILPIGQNFVYQNNIITICQQLFPQRKQQEYIPYIIYIYHLLKFSPMRIFNDCIHSFCGIVTIVRSTPVAIGFFSNHLKTLKCTLLSSWSAVDQRITNHYLLESWKKTLRLAFKVEINSDLLPSHLCCSLTGTLGWQVGWKSIYRRPHDSQTEQTVWIRININNRATWSTQRNVAGFLNLKAQGRRSASVPVRSGKSVAVNQWFSYFHVGGKRRNGYTKFLFWWGTACPPCFKRHGSNR